jgi:drug/metabolite transporter (DMT)-like permease
VAGLVLAAALVHTVLQALGDVLQHRAVSSAGDRRGPMLGGLMRNRGWRRGLLVIVIGFVFQVLAIRWGKVVTVQTILVSVLIWVLVFAVLLEHVRLTSSEYTGSALVVAGIVLFVLSVRPEQTGRTVHAVGWAIAFPLLLALIGVVVDVGRRLKPASAATVIGVAGGVAGGLAAGLIGALTDIGHTHGIGHVFTSWLLYACLATEVLAVLVPTWAFQAGPITRAIPTVVMLNPLTAYALGVLLLDEHVHLTGIEGVGLALGVALMVGGVLTLARSKIVAAQFAEAERIA